MPDWNIILHVLTLALLGVGSYVLATFKTGTDALVKTSAEEGVKAAFRDLEWSKDLARELQKTRGLERQELRFRSYGALWKELRPLAIYEVAVINNKAAGELLQKLTAWYFGECGGLLLTSNVREFYFALQDLLRVTSTMPGEWQADRAEELEGQAESAFRKIVEVRFPKVLSPASRSPEEARPDGTDAARFDDGIDVLDYFKRGRRETWQAQPLELGKAWRRTVNQLAAIWMELTERERFAVLQQVGSKLRSSMVNDLESRER